MNTNIIYNEDCLTTMSNKIDEKSINIILTSPPYNMTKRKGGYADKQPRYDVYIDWKDEQDYIDWTTNIFKSFDNILKENGVILYNFSYSTENPALPYKVICAIMGETNFTLADTIVWKKSNSIPHPASCNKKVVKVSPKNQKYYEIIDNIIFAKNNDGSTSLNKATYSSELCDQLLKIYTSENEIVYDPFMGTGTTAISCINNNLKYVGSEISKDQVEFSNERIKNV